MLWNGIQVNHISWEGTDFPREPSGEKRKYLASICWSLYNILQSLFPAKMHTAKRSLKKGEKRTTLVNL